LVSPLFPAEDAVEIDTSNMKTDEVVNTLLEIVALKGFFAEAND
jgi:cytidylate kinase